MATLTDLDVSKLYDKALRFVLREGTKVSPRGRLTYECSNVVMNCKTPTVQLPWTKDESRNRTMIEYASRELDLYNRGELTAEAWGNEASKFWLQLANPDGTINSNYGALTMKEASARGSWIGTDPVTQWSWAKRSLEDDPHTRQAVMHFNQPKHQWQGNKDFPCTLTGTFSIREGLLKYTIVMRSQDCVLGWPYDVFYFMWQQFQMAKELGVGVGMFTLIVHSLHIYDVDRDTVIKMIGEDIVNS